MSFIVFKVGRGQLNIVNTSKFDTKATCSLSVLLTYSAFYSNTEKAHTNEFSLHIFHLNQLDPNSLQNVPKT